MPSICFSHDTDCVVGEMPDVLLDDWIPRLTQQVRRCGDGGKEVGSRILGYPDDRHCAFILSFGYPADPSDLDRPRRTGGRQPLEALVHRETW